MTPTALGPPAAQAPETTCGRLALFFGTPPVHDHLADYQSDQAVKSGIYRPEEEQHSRPIRVYWILRCDVQNRNKDSQDAERSRYRRSMRNKACHHRNEIPDDADADYPLQAEFSFSRHRLLPGAHISFLRCGMCTVSWKKRGYQDLLSLEQNTFGRVR